MKKILACLLIAVMVTFTFVSCGNNNPPTNNNAKPDNSQNDAAGSNNTDNSEPQDSTKDTNETVDTSKSTESSEEIEEEPTGVTTSSIGLQYLLNEDRKSYTVVGIGSCTETDIVIDKYNGLPVTIIGIEAFRLCENLKSVTMKEGVLRICDFAFAYCDNLEAVTIPASVTQIGKGILNYCDKIDSVDYKGTLEQWNGISFDGNPIYGSGLSVNFVGSCFHNVWDGNTCLDCGTTCDHNGTEKWISNSSTHTKILSCCGMVLEAPELHETIGGTCIICGYEE